VFDEAVMRFPPLQLRRSFPKGREVVIRKLPGSAGCESDVLAGRRVLPISRARRSCRFRPGDQGAGRALERIAGLPIEGGSARSVADGEPDTETVRAETACVRARSRGHGAARSGVRTGAESRFPHEQVYGCRHDPVVDLCRGHPEKMP